MTLKNPEAALCSLIVAAATAAGTNVFAMRAPHGITTPFVIFQRVTSERWRALNTASGMAQATIRIDAYAPDYYAAKALAAQIEAAIEGYRGIVYYGLNSPQESVWLAGVSIQSDFDLQDNTDEPFMFRNSASYLVTYNQNT